VVAFCVIGTHFAAINRKESSLSLTIRPTSLKVANDFVSKNHRHHKPTQGCKFALSVWSESEMVGVAIAGRPVARNADDGQTLEVTRLCCDGTRNSASMLLGAIRKAGDAMGYARIITYTLPEEGGASLRAAGFVLLGKAGGGSWSRPSRERVDKAPLQEKLKWESMT